MTRAVALDPTLKRLADCKHVLHVLKSSPTAVQKAILQNADPSLLMCLCDIAVNVLNGNIRLSPESFARLEKFKKLIRSVAAKPATGLAVHQHGAVQGGRGGATAVTRDGGGGGHPSRRSGARARGRRASSSGSAGQQRGSGTAAWCRQKRRFFTQKGRGPFLTALLTSALGGIVGKVVSHYLPKQEQNVANSRRGAGGQ